MSYYKKISKKSSEGSYDEKLYALLNTERYCKHPYETVDLGESMSVINQVIWGWWKPRFLLNHNTKCAYEFMDSNEQLMTVTTEDIDWESLKGLPEDALHRAMALSFHFPSFIHCFSSGVAEVSWQLNPDGRYYMDDDGFGMTDDEEIEIYGFIDQNANVVAKFRNIKNKNELAEMRHQAINNIKQ